MPAAGSVAADLPSRGLKIGFAVGFDIDLDIGLENRVGGRLK
jgi:hypothetical protein